MTAPVAPALIERLRRRQDDMVDLLVALAQAESPSSVPQSIAPAQRLLTDALRQAGCQVELVPGECSAGHLLAWWPEREPQQPLQLLLGHVDTVWPQGTLERMPVVVRQGRLYGPGVYDMKAGLVQAIFALDALRALGEPVAVAPVVLINSDEEIGSPDSSPHICRWAPLADRALVMEPSLGPSGALKTARKGVGRFTIRVVGQAAHAGLDPGKGASAILELSHVVQRLFAINDPQRGITVNVGMIDGGLRPNVVAAESHAEVDVRVPTLEAAREVEQAIYALQPMVAGTQLHVSGGFGRPPMEQTPGNRQLWHLAVQAARDLDIPLEEATAGGGSDGNLTSQFTPTLDGLGAVGDGAHALDEHIVLDTLPQRAALLASLLLAPRISPATGPIARDAQFSE